MSWLFSLPTQVVFGEGAADELPAYLAGLGLRALLVTDARLLEQPFLQRLREGGPWLDVFAEVQPNPTVANVDALAVAAADARACRTSTICDFSITAPKGQASMHLPQKMHFE